MFIDFMFYTLTSEVYIFQIFIYTKISNLKKLSNEVIVRLMKENFLSTGSCIFKSF